MFIMELNNPAFLVCTTIVSVVKPPMVVTAGGESEPKVVSTFPFQVRDNLCWDT